MVLVEEDVKSVVPSADLGVVLASDSGLSSGYSESHTTVRS